MPGLAVPWLTICSTWATTGGPRGFNLKLPSTFSFGVVPLSTVCVRMKFDQQCRRLIKEQRAIRQRSRTAVVTFIFAAPLSRLARFHVHAPRGTTGLRRHEFLLLVHGSRSLEGLENNLARFVIANLENRSLPTFLQRMNQGVLLGPLARNCVNPEPHSRFVKTATGEFRHPLPSPDFSFSFSHDVL